jgi:hypothetical protein
MLFLVIESIESVESVESEISRQLAAGSKPNYRTLEPPNVSSSDAVHSYPRTFERFSVDAEPPNSRTVEQSNGFVQSTESVELEGNWQQAGNLPRAFPRGAA